jgi:hypothetical protein
MDGKMRGSDNVMQENYREFNPGQNDAGLESISQTVQKLMHFVYIPKEYLERGCYPRKLF